MIYMFYDTDCPDGEGITYVTDGDVSSTVCGPCLEGWYVSDIYPVCVQCPDGYTNGVVGATDDSGCTSMYNF